MSESWFCRIKGQVEGPLSLPELQERAVTGKLQLTDYVRQDKQASWFPAGNFAEIWATIPRAVASEETIPPADEEPLKLEPLQPTATSRTPTPSRATAEPRRKAGAKSSTKPAKEKAAAPGKGAAAPGKAAAPKPKVPLVVLAGSGIFFAVVVFIGLSFLVGGGTTTVEEVLKRNAAQHNKNLPRQVDPEVRFESVTAGPGRKMTLRYTMTKLEGTKLDYVAEERAKAVEEAAIKLFRSSKEGEYYRVNKVQVVCSVCNKHKREVTTILIKPGEK